MVDKIKWDGDFDELINEFNVSTMRLFIGKDGSWKTLREGTRDWDFHCDDVCSNGDLMEQIQDAFSMGRHQETFDRICLLLDEPKISTCSGHRLIQSFVIPWFTTMSGRDYPYDNERIKIGDYQFHVILKRFKEFDTTLDELLTLVEIIFKFQDKCRHYRDPEPSTVVRDYLVTLLARIDIKEHSNMEKIMQYNRSHNLTPNCPDYTVVKEFLLELMEKGIESEYYDFTVFVFLQKCRLTVDDYSRIKKILLHVVGTVSYNRVYAWLREFGLWHQICWNSDPTEALFLWKIYMGHQISDGGCSYIVSHVLPELFARLKEKTGLLEDRDALKVIFDTVEMKWYRDSRYSTSFVDAMKNLQTQNLDTTHSVDVHNVDFTWMKTGLIPIDITLTCKDRQIEAHSVVMKTLSKKVQAGILTFEEDTVEVVQRVVDGLYSGSINVDGLELTQIKQIMKFCQDLNIPKFDMRNFQSVLLCLYKQKTDYTTRRKIRKLAHKYKMNPLMCECIKLVFERSW